jgi:hypothetical protein
MAEGFASPSIGAAIPGAGDSGMRVERGRAGEFGRENSEMITQSCCKLFYDRSWQEGESRPSDISGRNRRDFCRFSRIGSMRSVDPKADVMLARMCARQTI